MPLFLGQLIYTSFASVGFKTFVGTQVAKEIQQAFMQQVVYQYWDAYNPPSFGYRAAYLHQLSPKHNLFGWLYNDGMDDLGRSHVPYFLCYYLTERLHSDQLENIFTCLQRGPVALIERNSFPKSLGTIVIPDVWSYKPARSGVVIPSDVREHSYIALQQRQLLNLFIPVEEKKIVAQISQHSYSQQKKNLSRDSSNWVKNSSTDAAAIPRDISAIEAEATKHNQGDKEKLKPTWSGKHEYSNSEYSDKQRKLSRPALGPNNETSNPMNTTKIDRILKELVSKPVGIQGAVLVSLEGQPITTPIGMNGNSALMMAGMMLYLAVKTREEFSWHNIENISVRGQEGHVILSACNQDIFLLIKAGSALTGLLDVEINRTIKKLQSELKAIEGTPMQLKEETELYSEVPFELDPEVSIETENEIRYRGRPINF